jgi:copper(I)-binding protein
MKTLAYYIIAFSLSIVMNSASYAQETQVSEPSRPPLGNHSVSSLVTFQDPWVRPGFMGRNTAVYGVVVNRGQNSVNLIRAECPLAKGTEIHTHIHDRGIMRMRPVETLDCPVGQTPLKPGGDHIMLMNLKEDLVEKEGNTVPITLYFSDHTEIHLDAPIKKP